MSFKNKFKMTSIALASAVAMGSMALPTVASADVGYNATVSSMYLWRGQDVSKGPTISGGIDFSDKSGLYANAWASSGLTNTPSATPASGEGYELDIDIGYAGEVSGFGYDISAWSIGYPQSKKKAGTEYALGLSYADFSLGYVSGEDKYTYTTLGYSYDKFSILYGASDADGSKYSHIDLGFAATDKLSFTVSKATDDSAGVAEETLIAVSYSLPI